MIWIVWMSANYEIFQSLNVVSIWEHEWLDELWICFKMWDFLIVPSSTWMGKNGRKTWNISEGMSDINYKRRGHFTTETNTWCLNGENTLKNVERVQGQNIRPQRHNNKMKKEKKKKRIPCAGFLLHSQPIRRAVTVNEYDSLVLCMLYSSKSNISNIRCLLE